MVGRLFPSRLCDKKVNIYKRSNLDGHLQVSVSSYSSPISFFFKVSKNKYKQHGGETQSSRNVLRQVFFFFLIPLTGGVIILLHMGLK